VGSRDDGRHSRAQAHLALTGGVTFGSLVPGSNTDHQRLKNAGGTGSASGGQVTDSGVPRSDIRECQRSTRSDEGGTRSEKGHGSSASSALKRRRSRGASGSARSKLAARIASSNPPPSWPREWSGSQGRGHLGRKRRWRRQATASWRNVLRGGRNHRTA